MSFSPPPPPPPLAPNGRPLADFGVRLGAYLIDGLLLGAVQLVFIAPIVIWWIFTVVDVTAVEANQDDPGLVFAAIILPMFAYIGALVVISMALTYGYHVEFVLRRNGQTIGKQLLKLQVTPVDPAAALTRNALLKRWAVQSVAGAFVPIFSYLDGFWQLWDKPLQQCLHDKAAQTVVVRIG